MFEFEILDMCGMGQDGSCPPLNDAVLIAAVLRHFGLDCNVVHEDPEEFRPTQFRLEEQVLAGIDAALATLWADQQFRTKKGVPATSFIQLWNFDEEGVPDRPEKLLPHLRLPSQLEKFFGPMANGDEECDFYIEQVILGLKQATLYVMSRVDPDYLEPIVLDWGEDMMVSFRVFNANNARYPFKEKHFIWNFREDGRTYLRLMKWQNSERGMILSECQQDGNDVRIDRYRIAASNIMTKTFRTCHADLVQAVKTGFLLPRV